MIGHEENDNSSSLFVGSMIFAFQINCKLIRNLSKQTVSVFNS